MNPKSNFDQAHVTAHRRCAPTVPAVNNSHASRFPRIAALSSLLVGIVLAVHPSISANQPAPPDQPRVPILLELFTSEGCSSCPPADDFVRRMDENQPVNGAQLIVLSEHVDYWDHDGWKDKYSSAQFTERQNGYVHALNLQTSYTPQMILDGSIVLKGNPSEIEQTFAKELKVPKIPVRIASATIEAPSRLKLRVEADGVEKHGGTVWVAVALDHAASQVSAGENSGKHLEHVAVVEELKKAGKLEKGKPFAQDVVLSLKPDIDPKNVRVIAFVQEPNEGRVLGAASLKLANADVHATTNPDDQGRALTASQLPRTR
jgi:hypothetical protein